MGSGRKVIVTALVIAAAGMSAASFWSLKETDEEITTAMSSKSAPAVTLPEEKAEVRPADSKPNDRQTLPTKGPTSESQFRPNQGPEVARQRSQRPRRREAFTPEDAEAFREQRQALQAKRRELAKNSPEVATERLAKRLRLTAEQTVSLAEINQRYAEQLRELDDFSGSDDELAVALRQADSQRLEAIVPILQESPALVEPMEKFMARAAEAGAVLVQPGQTQTTQDWELKAGR